MSSAGASRERSGPGGRSPAVAGTRSTTMTAGAGPPPVMVMTSFPPARATSKRSPPACRRPSKVSSSTRSVRSKGLTS
jgi:hypothetical protein